MVTIEIQPSVVQFADRHFERFVEWGKQLLSREVVAVVTGPGQGNVLGGKRLAGHYIGSIHRSARQEDVERFGRFGFTEPEYREGLWVVMPSQYDAKQQEIPPQRGHAFVCWTGDGWKVVRSNNDKPLQGETTSWAAPSTELGATEQNALRRVVEESEVMLDAAIALGADSRRYWELDKELARRAVGGNEAAINILTEPWQKRHKLSHRLQPSVHQLANNGPALSRALAGADARDSTDPLFSIPLLLTPLLSSQNVCIC